MSQHLLPTHIDSTIQEQPIQKLLGGYVEFSVLEDTHVHYFTDADEPQTMEYHLSIGKPLTGLKQFIRDYYMPAKGIKHSLSDDHIIIWNYEFIIE